MNKIIIIIIAVISVAPYVTDKGEYTTLYMINTKVYIETSKTIHCDNIVFHSFKRWLCEHALFFWLYNDAPSGGCEGYEDVASP